MALNPFFLQGSTNEQFLVQDIINEQLKIYGIEVYYLPRKIFKTDNIIREIQSSKFDDSYLRSLKDAHPGVRFLIMSMHPEEIYGPTVRKMGAAGYISKDDDPKQVIQAVTEVMDGKEIFNETLYKVNTPIKEKERKIKLSTRESEVLKLLSIGKSNKDISEELGISDKTVSTYKQRLLNKLQAKNLVDLINYAKMYQFV